jgi:hypothetical protein
MKRQLRILLKKFGIILKSHDDLHLLGFFSILISLLKDIENNFIFFRK